MESGNVAMYFLAHLRQVYVTQPSFPNSRKWLSLPALPSRMLASRIDERNPPQLHTNCNLTPRLRRVITQEQTILFVAKWDNFGLLGPTAIYDDANGRMAWNVFVLAPVGRRKWSDEFQGRAVLASVAMRREIENRESGVKNV